MLAARLTLTVWLVFAAANARPHHQFYHAGQGPVPGGYFYVPQADAGSVVSVQRYAAPVPVGLPPAPAPAAPGTPQYVLLYPGGGVQHNFVYGRVDEAEDENRPNIWNLFNLFQRPTTEPTIEAEEDEVVTTAKSAVTTTTSTSTVATTVEETTPKPNDEASAKPEKILSDKAEIMLAVEQSAAGTTDERKASLENLDENLPPSPDNDAGRQFTYVQRPQFFGNYDFLNQGNMHQSFGLPPGAVSNFLLFRNGFAQPGLMPAPVQPGRPLKQMEAVPAETLPYITPGSAALAFQKELRDAHRKHVEGSGDVDRASTRLAHVPGSQQVDVSQMFRQGVNPHFYAATGLVSLHPNQQVFVPRQVPAADPGIVNLGPGHQNVFLVTPGVNQGVVVDADKPRTEDTVEAEQAGPSVAQAKPQAIALAGVGGVASAAPVATAVVGPGGLAVAAPTATAVAGPSGGGALIGPAQAAVAAVNKQVNTTKTKNRGQSNDYTYEDDTHQ